MQKRTIPKDSAEKVGVKEVDEHSKADRECRMVAPRYEWVTEGLGALSMLPTCQSKKLLGGLYDTKG